MVEKYKGNSCKTARIKIDYRGLKPKVNFSYPDKKNQEQYSMFPFIFIFWGSFIIFSFVVGSLIYPEDIDEEEKVDFSNYGACMNWYKNYSNDRCEIREGKESSLVFFSELKKDLLDDGWFKLIFLLVLFIPPFIIYYPFKEYWSNVFPKFQAHDIEKKLVIFKPKDIKKEANIYFVEIPLFENIILDYDAKKDFSTYLDYFEIKEYRFKYVKGKDLKSMRKKKNKKNAKKMKVNEKLWYAKFYFSQKPLNGKLEVLFR